MAIETTYSAARANLASLLDAATNDRDIVIIKRRGKGDVALIAAEELEGLLETAHLLRSPRNASRLLAALERARSGSGRLESIADLKVNIGLGDEGES